jgi:putative oxidoreductase
MQRLYSTFPNGVPGCGLLLLRFAAGLPLILHGAEVFQGTPDLMSAGVSLIGMVTEALLIAGLWTPYAGVLQALVEVWIGVRSGTLADTHFVRATLGLSLAALGPGAWSIDARLFGRTRIDV